MKTEEHTAGTILQLGGYFTQAVYLHGQVGCELERRIGYYRGRLNGGWYLAYFEEKPGPFQFELQGYSQLSGGVERGHLPVNVGKPDVEQRARSEGFLDIEKAKNNFVQNKFTAHGSSRLAKVIPVGDADDNVEMHFPPGSGIPQWKLAPNVKLKARIVGKFSYEQKWSGGYN